MNLDALLNGTVRQREAHQTWLDLEISRRLALYHPALVGTLPIDLDVGTSDLDIVCEAYDLEAFGKEVQAHYEVMPRFETHRTQSAGVPAVVCSFETTHFPIQIFAQGVPVHRQRAYRHMVAERRLLALAGSDAREELRRLRRAGLKTEPAFGGFFRLKGDPYDALYDLADAPDDVLIDIVGARYVPSTPIPPGMTSGFSQFP